MNFHGSSSAGSLLCHSSDQAMVASTDDAPLDLTRRICSSDHRELSLRHTAAAQRTVLTSEGSSSRVVDEHFERSLGMKYSQLIKYPSAPSSAPPTTPNLASSTVDASSGTSLISVSGTVDDHFSKSLGDMWRQVKDNKTSAGAGGGGGSNGGSMVISAAAPRTEVACAAGSVDDHFAKALGDEMWLRIKADQEQAASSSSSSSRSTSVPPSSTNVVQFYPT
jgi:hypothetical protein